MHELALAESIVDIAERHAAGRKVMAVEVKVGHLRQVVPPALEFAFELVAQGTVVEGAELKLEHVPARGACRSCGTVGELREFPFTCSACDGFDIEVTEGEELQVESLELEEDELIANANGGVAYGG